MVESEDKKKKNGWVTAISSILGLVATLWWLTLRPKYPTISIKDFYVPALDKALNYNATNANSSVYFDIELDNKEQYEGIYYNALNFTLYYNSNQTYLPIGNQTFDGFYQGHKKTTSRTGAVETVGVPWVQVFGAVSNGSKPVFRVGLVTSLKFKVLTRKSKTRKWAIGADVEVNDEGKKDEKKGIKLKSGALGIRCDPTWPLALGTSIILFSLLSTST